MTRTVSNVRRITLVMTIVTTLAGRVLAAEVVDTPKVLPDRAVDTSSLDSIVQGVVKPGMSQQEKFLALYQFYRRMVFHHRYMAADRREILAVINSYGFNLCGSQAGSFSVLLRHAGFNTRVVHVSTQTAYGGHTAMEVEYDGKWHAFDTMTAFYVLKKDGQIASFEELKADPSLIRDAEKENRAPPEFCLCSREIEPEQEGIKEFIKADNKWTLLRWGPGTTVTGFWAIAVNNYKTDPSTYGGYVEPGRMDITLKPNEEYVRLWDPVGLWLKDPSFAKFGPFHTCGHIDELDTPHFKYFEPYKKAMPFTRYAYRYYGNGWLEWKPDAKKGELKTFAQAVTGLEPDAASGMLKTAAAAPGSVTLRMKSPYAMVKVELDLSLDQPDGAATTVSLGPVGKNGKANLAKVWEKTGKAQGVEKIEFVNDKNPIYLYDVRIEARGGEVKLDVARLKTFFQLNWASLPSLHPGENTITVSAKTEQKLLENKLLITTEWADGKDWTAEHKDTQTLTELPATYKLAADVPTNKMPRMKRLVMRLEAK